MPGAAPGGHPGTAGLGGPATRLYLRGHGRQRQRRPSGDGRRRALAGTYLRRRSGSSPCWVTSATTAASPGGSTACSSGPVRSSTQVSGSSSPSATTTSPCTTARRGSRRSRRSCSCSARRRGSTGRPTARPTSSISTPACLPSSGRGLEQRDWLDAALAATNQWKIVPSTTRCTRRAATAPPRRPEVLEPILSPPPRGPRAGRPRPPLRAHPSPRGRHLRGQRRGLQDHRGRPQRLHGRRRVDPGVRPLRGPGRPAARAPASVPTAASSTASSCAPGRDDEAPGLDWLRRRSTGRSTSA